MKFQKTAISLVVASTLFSTHTVLAQQSSSGFALEEVIVTARKREENLQNTPLSVSAFTANELQQRQVRSTDQLADVTPNLTFDAFAPSSGQNASSQATDPLQTSFWKSAGQCLDRPMGAWGGLHGIARGLEQYQIRLGFEG